MAEVTGLRSNATPYPLYGAPFGVVFPILDNTGAFVSGAAGLDSEVSKNGDTFADCTNEAVEIGSTGLYYLLLSGTELAADVVAVQVKTSTTDAKSTPLVLYPRKLVTIRSGTSASGGSDTDGIVLDSGASDQDDFYNGMVVIATIDSVVEVRVISDYVGSTKKASVVPDFNTAPDNNDTFIVKLPEGWQLHQANTTHIAGNGAAASALDRSARTIVRGAVDSGASTTSIPTSALDPAAAADDQFRGRVVLFDRDTTTAELRGQGSDISASAADGTLTLSVALTDAPSAGDSFVIL